MKNNLKNDIIEILKKDKENARSYWKRGVVAYALEMVEDCDFSKVSDKDSLKKALLGGARNWHEYSLGGCALVYDSDIAERLCPPSAYKRKKEGNLPPNSCETWLDVQARALLQGCCWVASAYRKAKEN